MHYMENQIEMKWMQEEKEQLRSLVLSGLTAREVAREMHITRNAVIGAAHRLGLSFTYTRGEREAKDGQPKKQRVRSTRFIPPPILVAKPPPPPPKPKPQKPMNYVSIMDLAYRQCRSVMSSTGGPSGTALYCGAPTEEGMSFCRFCASIYYQPRGSSHDKRIISSSTSRQGRTGEVVEFQAKRTATAA